MSVNADFMHRMKKWQILFLMPFLTLALIFQSCGKTGDPVPPDLVMRKGITNLTARIERGGVVLNWNIAGKVADVARFRILRSERDIKNDCAACYRKQAVLADLPIGDGRLQTDGKGVLTYRDMEVVSGHAYTYVIFSCDASQHCSAASNTAEIEFRNKE